MIFMLLKTGGLDYIPENVLNDWGLEPSRSWQAGEEGPAGTPYPDCGFNLTLPNHESAADAIAWLEDYLEDRPEMFHELLSLGAVMELHVGTSLAADETVAQPLTFPRSVLAALTACEVELSVIAFRSDGEN